MTRARVEGLLTSFPKLIPTNSQHTSVETADVRYVYQPLEDLYILLITNKGSNILQDIDTLHLFARVVSDLCRTADEKEILRNAFELLSAFDEIVSLGYRENVNLMQVRSILEMESHEERIQDIISRVSTPFTLSPAEFLFDVSRLEQRSRGKGGAQEARKTTRTATTADYSTQCWWKQLSWQWHGQQFVPEPSSLRNSKSPADAVGLTRSTFIRPTAHVQGLWHETWQKGKAKRPAGCTGRRSHYPQRLYANHPGTGHS